MPPIEPESAVYLELLFDAGPVQSGGFGPQALAWSELADWIRLTGTQLTAQEIRFIRRLSLIYAGALSELRAEDAVAPWPEKSAEERIESANEQIGLALRAMTTKRRASQ